MPEITTNHTSWPIDPVPPTSPVPPVPPVPHDADVPPLERPVPDLRRRNGRLQAELIARRACFLPHEQRALIIAVYAHGQSFSELAAISGQSVRQLRRDVRRILSRLASREFVFVALHVQQWPVTMRRVAQTCVLAGEPVRSASRTLRLSLHTVRKHRDRVLLLASGVSDSDDPRSKS